MAKQPRKVWLGLEEAHAALSILEGLISEKMHAGDRKQIDSLIGKTKKALDTAQASLSEALSDARTALDRI